MNRRFAAKTATHPFPPDTSHVRASGTGYPLPATSPLRQNRQPPRTCTAGVSPAHFPAESAIRTVMRGARQNRQLTLCQRLHSGRIGNCLTITPPHRVGVSAGRPPTGHIHSGKIGNRIYLRPARGAATRIPAKTATATVGLAAGLQPTISNPTIPAPPLALPDCAAPFSAHGEGPGMRSPNLRQKRQPPALSPWPSVLSVSSVVYSSPANICSR